MSLHRSTKYDLYHDVAYPFPKIPQKSKCKSRRRRLVEAETRQRPETCRGPNLARSELQRVPELAWELSEVDRRRSLEASVSLRLALQPSHPETHSPGLLPCPSIDEPALSNLPDSSKSPGISDGLRGPSRGIQLVRYTNKTIVRCCRQEISPFGY